MNAKKRNGRINRLARMATVLGAGLAFALTAVPDAGAGHRDDDSDRGSRYQDRDQRSRNHTRVVTIERHPKHDRHPGHHRHCWKHSAQHYGHGHAYGHGHGYQHWQPRRARVVRVHDDGRYYCKPCRHSFKSRHDFRGHLHQHHHVPLWKLPFVIVHSAIGWIFHG